MEKKLSVGQNTLFNSVGSLYYLGCQWLLTVLVVRLGSYESAGILSLCMSITNLFYTLASFGIRDFQVSDYNGKYSPAQYVSTRLLTCTVSAGLCCAVVGLNRGYTGYEAACIIVYMLYRVAEALVDTFQAMEQKAERMDYNFISFVLRGTLLLVGFSAVLYLTKNLLLAIASIAVTSFAVVLLFDVPIGKKLTGFRLSFSLSAKMCIRDRHEGDHESLRAYLRHGGGGDHRQRYAGTNPQRPQGGCGLSGEGGLSVKG